MAFESLGKTPKIINVPSWLYMAFIRVTRFIGHFSRKIGVFSEFLHVTYYYLHDDMRAPGYGTRTLRQHMLGSEQSVRTADSQADQRPGVI